MFEPWRILIDASVILKDVEMVARAPKSNVNKAYGEHGGKDLCIMQVEITFFTH